ncbi:MAG TPA: hypothetical protein H9780_07175 [Candidatus Mediterraneibacter merdavium]|nr:hypothetical protein [Candidatus Mediterraneibacter merdavium]
MKKKTNKELIDDYDYLTNAASTMDCTGLIPSLPQSEEELDSYNDIVQYMPPTVLDKTDGKHYQKAEGSISNNAAEKDSSSGK